MQFALKATEVRNNFSAVMEQAARVKPQPVRRLRDMIFFMSADHLDVMLRAYRLTLRIRQDGDQFIGAFDQLDIIDSAPSVKQLKHDLALALKEYAEEYYREFETYVKAPNRQAHLPYVWRILMQDDPDEVMKLFDAYME